MLDSFVYQYAIEALVFGVGVFAGIRTGVLDPSNPRGRRRLAILVAGLLAMFVLQGVFLVWGK